MVEVLINGEPYIKVAEMQDIVLKKISDEKRDNDELGYSNDYNLGFKDCEHFVKLAIQHIEDEIRKEK